MAQFKDLEGRVWEFKITARMVDACETESGDSFFGEMTGGKIPVRLAWRLVYFATREKAKALGFEDYAAWLDGIGKRAIGDMTAAAMTEIAGFFPEPEAKKNARPPVAGPGETSTN